MKIIANYLPQYHEIPENNYFWGNGYTDWIAVKNAKPVLEGQIQPNVPLGNHYYQLDNADEIKRQAEIAKSHGVYGFGIYHYWFSTNNYLLERPAEIILENKDIDIQFLFLWDNSTWKRTWSNVKNANDWAPNYDAIKPENASETGILKELKYGNERDWEIHFLYLLPFFKDERYIKINGKPVFGIFQPQNDFDTIKKMTNYMEMLALKNGLPGLHIMIRDDRRPYDFPNKFKYSPFVPCTFLHYIKYKIRQYLSKQNNKPLVVQYDDCWREILKEAKKAGRNTYLSGFVKYDDTPRRGAKAKIVVGASPLKFRKYLKELISISQKQGKELIFLTAWNEWGEGAYLEPDEENEYSYLEAIKSLLLENGENEY